MAHTATSQTCLITQVCFRHSVAACLWLFQLHHGGWLSHKLLLKYILPVKHRPLVCVALIWKWAVTSLGNTTEAFPWRRGSAMFDTWWFDHKLITLLQHSDTNLFHLSRIAGSIYCSRLTSLGFLVNVYIHAQASPPRWLHCVHFNSWTFTFIDRFRA